MDSIGVEDLLNENVSNIMASQRSEAPRESIMRLVEDVEAINTNPTKSPSDSLMDEDILDQYDDLARASSIAPSKSSKKQNEEEIQTNSQNNDKSLDWVFENTKSATQHEETKHQSIGVSYESEKSSVKESKN